MHHRYTSTYLAFYITLTQWYHIIESSSYLSCHNSIEVAGNHSQFQTKPRDFFKPIHIPYFRCIIGDNEISLKNHLKSSYLFHIKHSKTDVLLRPVKCNNWLC